MEINVNISRKDYLEFNLFYHFKKRRNDKLLMIVGIAIVLPLVMNFILNTPFNFLDFVFEAVSIAFFYSIFMVVFILITVFITSKLPSKSGVFLGQKKYVITEGGFIEESNVNHNILKWNGIKSLYQNKNSIYIFIEFNAAIIIPKRYFNNSKEIDNFVLEINERISAS